jgi:ribosomal protein S27E
MLSQETKNRIIEVLNTRLRANGRAVQCPMCGHNNFAISDAYISNSLQDDFQNIVLGGPSIPSIAVICTNCGFISQHALGVLGLMPQPQPVQEGGDHGQS